MDLLDHISQKTGDEKTSFGFQALNAGPLFPFNLSISIMVNFDPSQNKDARQWIDEI